MEQAASVMGCATSVVPTGVLRMGEPDVHLAQRAVRVHCGMSWPQGVLCNNCGRRFPCFVFRWGYTLLSRAGWTEKQIAALNTRTGAWS